MGLVIETVQNGNLSARIKGQAYRTGSWQFIVEDTCARSRCDYISIGLWESMGFREYGIYHALLLLLRACLPFNHQWLLSLLLEKRVAMLGDHCCLVKWLHFQSLLQQMMNVLERLWDNLMTLNPLIRLHCILEYGSFCLNPLFL